MVGNGLEVCPLAAVIVDKMRERLVRVVEMGVGELGELAKGD
jgi:hypothetical protein